MIFITTGAHSPVVVNNWDPAPVDDCERGSESASVLVQCPSILTNLIRLESNSTFACGPESSSQLDDVQVLDPTTSSLLGREKLGVHRQTQPLDLLGELRSGSRVPTKFQEGQLGSETTRTSATDQSLGSALPPMATCPDLRRGIV